MKLVVGLGNPGPRYARTRHNVGFMVLDRLCAAHGLPEPREKFNGFWTKGSVEGEDVVMLWPQTFMNESGRSVQPAVAFFHVAVKAAGGSDSELLVIHDELDLAYGDVRLKVGGGHAGHNGLRSIMAVLGGDFARLRVGIGRPPPGFRGEVADYVLSEFDPVEAATLPDVVDRSVEAVRRYLRHGASAMNQTNVRSAKGKKSS